MTRIRFSDLIGRRVIETDNGRIINKFSIKTRRNVLFFADILANYIKECEDAGFADAMDKIGYKWTFLSVQELMPKTIRIVPVSIKMNVMLKKVWTNIGALTDLSFSESNGTIVLKTKNEVVREIIGDNHYSTGSFRGILCALYHKNIDVIDVKSSGIACTYKFKLADAPLENIQAKDKDTYNKMNYNYSSPGEGMKKAITDGVFNVKDNRLYFRDRPMFLTESTLYHIIGAAGPILDSVPTIARNYFRRLVPDTDADGRLMTIKNILQATGWGTANIITRGQSVTFIISHPPYGLQKEPDNWSFLLGTILGYMQTIDKNYKQTGYSMENDTIAVVYQK